MLQRAIQRMRSARLLDGVNSLAKGEPVPAVPLPVGRVVVPFRSLAVVEE